MSDALTPERRATLRSRAEAMLGGEYNRVVHVPAQTLLTLLDAADEVAKLREEVESHREARQMLADDLIALGKGNPGKLELSYGVEQRIAALETENATLRAENADLDHDLSDHDALFNRNCALNERVAELECDAAQLRYAAASRRPARRSGSGSHRPSTPPNRNSPPCAPNATNSASKSRNCGRLLTITSFATVESERADATGVAY